jgi:hypothetical protein
LCHQIKTREQVKMLLEGVANKRENFKRKEQEAIYYMESMRNHEHAYDSVNAPKSHKKLKKMTGDLSREQHGARLDMPCVHETAINTKRQRILTQMKERQTSVAHSKQQRGALAPVPQAMQEFRHAQDVLVQARNRLLAHQSLILPQKEQLQLARRSPLVEGDVRHNQYVVLDPCATDASIASLEHTIAMQQHALCYHLSVAGGRNQQLYPADGTQQGPSVRPASVGGAGSCIPTVEALFQSIFKKQAIKQEIERLAERNRQLAEAHVAMEDSTRPGSTPRAAARSATMSLYQKKNACTSRLHNKSGAFDDADVVTPTMPFPQAVGSMTPNSAPNMSYGHHLGVPYTGTH